MLDNKSFAVKITSVSEKKVPTFQELQEGFNDVIRMVKREKKKETFSDVAKMFDDACKKVVHDRKWLAEEANEQSDLNSFNFTFSSDSPFWGNSIEILEVMGHYVVFDRRGNFAIYVKDAGHFGNLYETNNKQEAISKLRGQSASSLLSNLKRGLR